MKSIKIMITVITENRKRVKFELLVKKIKTMVQVCNNEKMIGKNIYVFKNSYVFYREDYNENEINKCISECNGYKFDDVLMDGFINGCIKSSEQMLSARNLAVAKCADILYGKIVEDTCRPLIFKKKHYVLKIRTAKNIDGLACEVTDY